jgi:hypothetical protein
MCGREALHTLILLLDKNSLTMRSFRDLIMIKLLTFMAVGKISFTVAGRVLVASACLCKKQGVTT